jgi:hypothetical protein
MVKTLMSGDSRASEMCIRHACCYNPTSRYVASVTVNQPDIKAHSMPKENTCRQRVMQMVL